MIRQKTLTILKKLVLCQQLQDSVQLVYIMLIKNTTNVQNKVKNEAEEAIKAIRRLEKKRSEKKCEDAWKRSAAKPSAALSAVKRNAAKGEEEAHKRFILLKIIIK